MNEEDRRLMTDTIAEMRELKGEMRAFKEYVTARLGRIEDGVDGRRRERLTVVGIFISVGLFTLNLIALALKA
jgi:hypothetical protein